MELFKLLGTIAVDNANANKALDETSDKGEKAQSKLSKAFGAMGKGAAVAGKAIAAGLAAGATAMAGLTVKALSAAGDLEQNMGGAEAVFGELGKTIGDMKTPMQTFNAETGKVETTMSSLETVSKEAYKNMGLSQSDYLATANKMGALFKGAGFETQEALDLSSQAMQRAADVASIMGIDTSAAMEAVAGAAKGNFTMMDNLGVAMNDTAIAAYAAEKGINKTTAEMTQQEKIGLAMEMFLEKTSYAAGNYAKENETLAGSLGTAKAALTNFLAGSGDVDSLVSSFSNLANVVVKSLSEIAPRLTQGLSEVMQKIVPLIPPLMNQLLPVLVEGAVNLVNGLIAAMPGIISAITAVLPTLINGVMQLITSLCAALPQIINPIIQALPQVIQSIVSALPTMIPALINGAVQLIVMLCTMLPQIIQPIIDNLPMIIQTIVTALQTNLPLLIQGVLQLVMGLVAALPQIFSVLVSSVVVVFKGIWDSIKGVFSGVGEWFSNVWASLGNVPGLAQLKTMVEQVWATIKNHITTVINAIKDVITTVWNSIKNVVSTVLDSIKNVITTAWNAIKTIISNAMKLIASVLKGDWEGVKTAISNILNAIKSVITSIWNGIKNTISSVLNGIKSVVSSVWNGIKSVVTSALNSIKSIVSSVWNGIKSAISNAVNGIKTTVTTGFNNVKNAVINAFKGLPSKLKSIGSELITGLWNGISDKFSWLTGKIQSFANNVTDKLKSFFGIKSPSRVMRDEVGKHLAEGVAVGITANSETAENAAETMAKNVLDAAQKRLDNYKVYNALTLADEVAFWDEVRKQVKEGTDARISADEKYLTAKQSMNDAILAAEESLQSSLDEINNKIIERQKSIMGNFDLFSEFELDDYVSGADMMESLDSNIWALEQYEGHMDILREKIGDTALFAELEEAGVGSLNKISALNQLSESQLQTYVEKYDRALSLANGIANKELAEETQAATHEAYVSYIESLSGSGVDIIETFAASASDIAETSNSEIDSMIEHIDRKESVFVLAASKVAQPFIEAADNISTAFDKVGKKISNFSVSYEDYMNLVGVPVMSQPNDSEIEWHAKAMDNAMVLNKPTIFGYDAATGKYLGGGEAGSEVVAGSQTLMNMIQAAVAEQNSAMTYYMQKLIGILAEFFPQVLNGLDRPISFDPVAGAAAMAIPMNDALGRLSSRKDRGR